MAIPEKEIMDFIGELFKGFADPTRVHILYLLAEREQCVSDIAERVELSQSAISHQLRILKQMQLIKFRREGKNILYSANISFLRQVLKLEPSSECVLLLFCDAPAYTMLGTSHQSWNLHGSQEAACRAR